MLEWLAIPFSRESSQLRDRTCVSFIGRWILYHLSHQGSFERPLFKNDQYLVGSKQTFHYFKLMENRCERMDCRAVTVGRKGS